MTEMDRAWVIIWPSGMKISQDNEVETIIKAWQDFPGGEGKEIKEGIES